MTIVEILEEFERRGMRQAALAKRLGVKQPTVSRWRSGSEPKTKHRDKLLQYAREKGILQPGEVVERMTVPVVGYVGAGGQLLHNEGQGPFGEVPMPPGGGRQTVAVVVRGGSMSPQIEDGWTVYYEDRREPPTDELIGKLCVIGLRDGRILVKKPYRGKTPGNYDLVSASGPIESEQAVEWAAKITFIRPA